MQIRIQFLGSDKRYKTYKELQIISIIKDITIPTFGSIADNTHRKKFLR